MMSNIKVPSSPKKLGVKLKNKINNVHYKKCKPEYRSSSLEGWSNR